MTPDETFDSFRDSRTSLDAAGERRIRDRFEELRDAERSDGTPAVTLTPGSGGAAVARRSRNRRWLAGIAAVIALVALVVGVRLTGDDRSQVTTGIDDIPLSELATVAAGRRDQELPADQVLFREVRRGQRVDGVGELAPTLGVDEVRQWAYRDGSGVQLTTTTYTPEGPGQVPEAPDGEQASRFTEPRPLFEVMPYDELRALPDTPEGLLDAARRVNPTQVPGDTAEFLSRVLSLDVTPPGARAAAFEALERIGAEPMGPYTDADGRTGIAFGDDTVDPSWMIVVDPRTTVVHAFAREIGPADAPITGARRWVEYGDQGLEARLPD